MVAVPRRGGWHEGSVPIGGIRRPLGAEAGGMKGLSPSVAVPISGIRRPLGAEAGGKKGLSTSVALLSDGFVDRLRKLVAHTLSVLARDRPGK